MPMMIGDLASRAGVNVQTVRYYERRGLLRDPERTSTGYRQYGADALERLRFIKGAQELGFTLIEVEDLLNLRVEDPASCSVVAERTRSKLADVRRKIRELQRMESVLTGLGSACAKRIQTAECPILESLVDMGENA